MSSCFDNPVPHIQHNYLHSQCYESAMLGRRRAGLRTMKDMWSYCWILKPSLNLMFGGISRWKRELVNHTNLRWVYISVWVQETCSLGKGGGSKPHFHGPYFLDLRLVSYSRRSTFVSEGCWGELMGKWCRMKPKPQCKLLRSKFVLLSVGRITQSWSFFGLGTPSVVKPTLMTTIAQAHFEFCHVTKTLCRI